MKKFLALLVSIVLAFASLFAQNNTRLGHAQVISRSDITGLPNFIKIKDTQLEQDNFVSWATYALGLPNNSTLQAYEVTQDALGYTHTRHKQYIDGVPVEGSMLISHSRNGQVELCNGDYYTAFQANAGASLSAAQALQYALEKVNAKKYMWENTTFQKQTGRNYAPAGELVMVHKKQTDFSANNMRLAYKFNIYAEVPLYRAHVFVDANTGEILDEQNLLCTIDVIGTANTRYSGLQTMSSDSTAPSSYRLRETGRGNGIETYNLQNGLTYQNLDFTNNSSAWNPTGADQVATDAHWGAEMTYDYYKNVYSRNSIDGNGFALHSYVHYSTNYVNAFWDGQEMTYGDGDTNQGFYPLVCMDVCGHEITHGLTNFTAGLQGGEAGALNEGFSDIFGTTIEVYARPLQNDWKMGAEIMLNGAGIRDMSNPKSLGQPDTYLGTNWDQGLEPHQDNGPCIYWYYLLCQGGTGTNDIGSVYNVSGITMTKAQMIAYRGLTVYFTPNTNYAMARAYTIQSALDLYGLCSPELQSTTNAWYAVGVGSQFSLTNVVPAFNNTPVSCAVPMSVTFTNTSANAASYYWSFGDGSTSTATSPAHTYTVAGMDTVKLVATSCSGNKDSVSKVLVIGATATATFITEGFEVTTLPGPAWTLTSNGNNWVITSAAAASGFQSAMIDNSTKTPNSVSTLESVSYDISAMVTPKLTFKMAYRQDTSINQDKLQILSSSDCGYSWMPRWTRSGSILATVTPPDTFPFFPASPQFITYTVNINALAGKNNVRFRFNFTADTSGGGNNIFIDDINLFDASVGVNEFDDLSSVELYPNPSEGRTDLVLNVKKRVAIMVEITDVFGRVIESFARAQDPGGEVKITLGEKMPYPAGIYLVRVKCGDEMITKKWVAR